VVTAEHDRLRGEAQKYAEKLDVAGSLVEYFEVGGVDHGYNIMSGDRDTTERMYSRIAGHVAAVTSAGC
jgi:acetyl esterase/lipase